MEVIDWLRDDLYLQVGHRLEETTRSVDFVVLCRRMCGPPYRHISPNPCATLLPYYHVVIASCAISEILGKVETRSKLSYGWVLHLYESLVFEDQVDVSRVQTVPEETARCYMPSIAMKKAHQ